MLVVDKQHGRSYLIIAGVLYIADSLYRGVHNPVGCVWNRPILAALNRSYKSNCIFDYFMPYKHSSFAVMHTHRESNT